MQNSTQFHFAKPENISDLQELLKSAELPNIDILKHIDNFVFMRDEKNALGCIGLEVYGEIALLRSLAVDKKYRNQGWGKILTKEILQYAAERQIKKVFLLTTTAELFFAKLGFIKMNRNAAPEAIRATTEFSSLCPDTAILMYKELQ